MEVVCSIIFIAILAYFTIVPMLEDKRRREMYRQKSVEYSIKGNDKMADIYTELYLRSCSRR